MRAKRLNLVNFIGGILVSIMTTIASLIITINSTFLYRYSINKFDLVAISGVSSDKIMSDYKKIIQYIQNPFIDKLEIKFFKMSKSGEFHFYEVQQIFKYTYLIIGTCIILSILAFYIAKRRNYKLNLLLISNFSSNIIVSLFIGLISAMAINFSKSFEIFHKILFNNNDWLFDPLLDPVITVLPEGVFMLYGIIILSVTLVFAIIFKGLYYINKMNKKRNIL